jgi:hypothetical protein
MAKHSKSKNSKYAAFGRTTANNSFKKNGKKRRIKTAVLIDRTMLEEANPNINTDFYDVLEKKYQKRIRSISTNCSVKEVTGLNENMSPVKVKVKNSKRPLKRIAKNGALHFFSNDPELMSVEEQPLPEVQSEKKFKDDPVVIKIHSKTDRPKNKKHVKATITKKSLKKTRKKIAKNNGKRHISQNDLMGGSATEYYRATRFEKRYRLRKSHRLKPVPQNHTHCISHGFTGPKSQNPKNIGVASTHTNTQMMLVEKQVPEIVNTSKRIKVKLDVVAPVIPKTHIINDYIKYNVKIEKKSKKKKKIKELNLQLSFHPQVRNKPDVSEGEYVGGLFESTFSLFKKSKRELEDLASRNSPVKYLTYYKK